MEILGYIASIFIGISLGLVGSGGSILTVPVLVYLMSINPVVATTSSLFIVGCTSLVGGLRAYAKKIVEFKAITDFGIPSIFSIFITRHYLLPAIPHGLFRVGSLLVTKDMALMVIFAVLMLAASFSMIKNSRTSYRKALTNQAPAKSYPLVFLGLFVGVVTGLLGAGGGFLIIPALVLFLKLPMKSAVGTSLLIIAINSLLGFLFSLKQFEYNWTVLIAFTVLSTIGLFIGTRLSERIAGNSLKKGFGWFILTMGVGIIVKEIFLS